MKLVTHKSRVVSKRNKKTKLCLWAIDARLKARDKEEIEYGHKENQKVTIRAVCVCVCEKKNALIKFFVDLM